MPQTVALALAAIGGAFVYAVLVSDGVLSIPSSANAATYYLTVAFIAFVNAGLLASANTVPE